MTVAPYQKTWLHDHTILCYRFNNLGNEAADAWYNDVVEAYRDWSQNQPLRLLADLRASGTLLSPDIVQRVREVSKQDFPNLEGKVAFLLAQGQDPKLLSLYMDHVLSPARQRNIFWDEAEAINWLLH